MMQTNSFVINDKTVYLLKKVCKRVLFFLFMAMIIFTSLYGMAFTWLLPELQEPLHQKLQSMPRLLIFAHAGLGAIALLSLALQTKARLINRKWHKKIGYLYCTAVSLSACASFYMAANAFGGIISSIGLISLAIIWLTSTYLGIYFARKKQYLNHQRCMIISIAMTLSAVSLRIELPLLNLLFAPMLAAQMVYYLAWIGNLVIALWLYRSVFFYQPIADI